MLVLTEEQIRPLLSWDDLIPAMEAALAAFSDGRVIQPVRNMITIEEGRRYLGVMPAVAEAAMGLVGPVLAFTLIALLRIATLDDGYHPARAALDDVVPVSDQHDLEQSIGYAPRT